MKEEIIEDDFIKIISYTLNDIDDYFKESKPMSVRPYYATYALIENYITIKKGDSVISDKQDFENSIWFKYIYQNVLEWYRRRYGKRLLKERPSDFGHAVVRIYNDFFLVRIPYILTRHNKDNSYWIIYPSSVQRGENIIEYIQDPPNIVNLSESENQKLLKKLRKYIREIRTIRANLLTAKIENENKDLKDSIMVHLKKSASLIVENKNSMALSLAFYELHMAVEKCLKIYISQKMQYPKTHDIRKLLMYVNDIDPVDAIELDIERFKKGDTSRYYNDCFTQEYLLETYENVIGLIMSITNKMERNMKIENTKVKIIEPGWKK
ncbi:hypothetical protein B4O97_14370 [Marispirochaeta aestuarii]|uniref:HEPN domain-containing protein n=1 Tax=Marispirochaeta aestuarii TaxID=1963862 RepID=A0A1Y1RV37_9SPIO|nr:HEPN domain-containing protein [Marispirochaeta aestuarii]ORC33845.1 hypothetical protein B4O97_14370 [Marispirochaeta aestuarii]